MNEHKLFLEINSFVYENKVFFSIVVASILGQIMKSSKSNIFTAWLSFLTGTFFHEIAHLVVGFLTFSIPYRFSILPKKSDDGDGYIMGYVKFLNSKWYNIGIVSLAPILLIPIAFFVYKYFFIYFDFNVKNFFIWVYIIVSLIFSSIPSSVDIGNIFQGNFLANLFGLILAFSIVLFIYYEGVLYGYF